MLLVCRCLGNGVVEIKIFRKIQGKIKSLLPTKFSDILNMLPFQIVNDSLKHYLAANTFISLLCFLTHNSTIAI